jgi:hypothetical protein
VYIGRGTSNYEGPLAYTTKALVAGFWSLTIPAGTTRYHNVTESVILAQGGDRIVNVGQVVGTPQGNATDAILFNTTQRTVLLDGETEVDDVPVVAQQSGTIGNVNTGAHPVRAGRGIHRYGSVELAAHPKRAAGRGR